MQKKSENVNQKQFQKQVEELLKKYRRGHKNEKKEQGRTKMRL